MPAEQSMRKQPILLGIVGDSGAGKTTFTKAITKVLGEHQVAVICTDDYHKYNRAERGKEPYPPASRLQLFGYCRATSIAGKSRATHTQAQLQPQHRRFCPTVLYSTERIYYCRRAIGLFYQNHARLL